MKEFKTLIDVRTPEEFDAGNVKNSINIPLNEVQERLEEIKSLPQPIMLCCLSGGRSGNATQFLESQSVDCFNGGGWKSVEFAIENGEVCWVD